jgi:hypothetical protein
MALIITPPDAFPIERPIVFLAGSIENGTASQWQQELIAHLSKFDVTILNPRRVHWDSNCATTIHNPVFVDQVNWELNGLTAANIIAMYFDPNTLSPITLLELGLFAAMRSHQQKIILYCPDGYWRKGNVDIVCRRYGVNQVGSYDDFLDTIEYNIRSLLAQDSIIDEDEDSYDEFLDNLESQFTQGTVVDEDE